MTNDTLVAAIRTVLAEDGITDVVAVVFTTQEWSNGRFFDPNAEAHGRNGEIDGIDFTGTTVADDLTDEYGTVGEDAGLGVNVFTGAVDFDDNVCNVYPAIGISVPKGR